MMVKQCLGKNMLKKLFGFSLLLFNSAYAETQIPKLIQVPNGHMPLFTLHAKGDQIYHCVFKENTFKWIVAPKAILFDNQGKIVGTHNQGPTWQHQDGSTILGKIIQKTDDSREQMMPWLLVEVTEYKGQGLLSNIAYINRVNTQGGLQPIKPCDNNHLGSEKPVAYQADYIFYSK